MNYNNGRLARKVIHWEGAEFWILQNWQIAAMATQLIEMDLHCVDEESEVLRIERLLGLPQPYTPDPTSASLSEDDSPEHRSA